MIDCQHCNSAKSICKLNVPQPKKKIIPEHDNIQVYLFRESNPIEWIEEQYGLELIVVNHNKATHFFNAIRSNQAINNTEIAMRYQNKRSKY